MIYGKHNRVWADKGEYHSSLGFFVKLTKNKGIESEAIWQKKFWEYFELSLRWDRMTDHAGIHFSFGLLWFNFTLDLYDFRHWDIEKQTWEE